MNLTLKTKKLSLKTKMLGTVLLLAVLSIALAGIGAVELSEVENENASIALATKKQLLTSDARYQMKSWFRAIEFHANGSLTPQLLAQIRERASSTSSQVEEDLGTLVPLLIYQDSRQRVDRIRELIGDYRKIDAQARSLYDQKKFDDVEQLLISALPLTEDVESLLGEILETNNKLEDAAFADSARDIHEGRIRLLWVSLAGIFAFVGMALWVILLGVIRPLGGITGAIHRVAEGNLDTDIPGVGRGDEIGGLAAALETFKRNGYERREMIASQERQQKAAVEEKRRTMNQLADGFESSVRAVVEALSQAVTQLQADAQGLSATADQTNRQAVAVAAAAEQATSNVQTVAAATEELSSSVNEISRQVSESSRIAGVAVDEANKTNVTVAGLSEAAQKIGEVVGLINNIASQTNLLALNATIEAARAGEAGKGFAVVASEVKNLANQTAKATDDIQGQVGQMQAVTGTAVDAIKGITGTIQRMSEITTTIASAVEEQGAATREIARNVQQASTGTREVSSNISGVTQAAGETGHMAGSVLGAAKELSRQTDRLRQEVDAFVRRVRNS